jgi:hypothetical protein
MSQRVRGEENIARLNYAFVAVKMKQVCVIDGFISHSFHVSLPKRTNFTSELNAINNILHCSDNQELCPKMKYMGRAIMGLTESLRDVIANMVNKIYVLVPEYRDQ